MKTDIAIIGGGAIGASVAYFLKLHDPSVDVTVVDTDGLVNAVSHLRIVDASIMPKPVTGNLNAPVMMMAEKIADCIRDKRPLPPSTASFYRNP
jgi:2-polyprenyl-6-methoxyphenol hydroxylase-like FAD-dependent oxidoreductase